MFVNTCVESEHTKEWRISLNLLWNKGQIKEEEEKRKEIYSLFVVLSVEAIFVRVTCRWVTCVDGSRNDDERNAPNTIMRWRTKKKKMKNREKQRCTVVSFYSSCSFHSCNSLCNCLSMMISALYCMNKCRSENSNRKIFFLSLSLFLEDYTTTLCMSTLSDEISCACFSSRFSIQKNKREEKNSNDISTSVFSSHKHSVTRFSLLSFFSSFFSSFVCNNDALELIGPMLLL